MALKDYIFIIGASGIGKTTLAKCDSDDLTWNEVLEKTEECSVHMRYHQGAYIYEKK